MDVEPYLVFSAKLVAVAIAHYNKNKKNEARIKKLEAEVKEIRQLIKKAS